MDLSERIVVVGASLAGVRGIEALRNAGYAGEIVAVSVEKDMPYDRPPLSKQFLKGKLEESQISLRRKGFDDLAVEWRLGTRATKLNSGHKMIELSTGDTLEYGGLMIATGSAPRSLPAAEGLQGVHLLRSLEDARGLRSGLQKGGRLVVIGAGFIGMEVAASAHELGLEVTVVEALSGPLLRGLGEKLGETIGNRFRERGVVLRCGVGVDGFIGEGQVEGIQLADGTAIEADHVLIGIGTIPVCDWLEDSGLELNRGILCDATGATNLPDVVAAGDVACWRDPRSEEHVRYEHWTSASEQGVVAARRLLAGPSAVDDLVPLPYVWSDLFELRLAMLGEPASADEMHVCHGELSSERFLALMGKQGVFIGAVGLKRPRELNGCRKLLADRVSFEQAVREIG
ncbi:MAG: hypothetical protein CL917_18370 [Deltaproteobacteria bacterium]|nr:hypothetical protein [Deltaproteobacteria bacterium]